MVDGAAIVGPPREFLPGELEELTHARARIAELEGREHQHLADVDELRRLAVATSEEIGDLRVQLTARSLSWRASRDQLQSALEDLAETQTKLELALSSTAAARAEAHVAQEALLEARVKEAALAQQAKQLDDACSALSASLSAERALSDQHRADRESDRSELEAARRTNLERDRQLKALAAQLETSQGAVARLELVRSELESSLCLADTVKADLADQLLSAETKASATADDQRSEEVGRLRTQTERLTHELDEERSAQRASEREREWRGRSGGDVTLREAQARAEAAESHRADVEQELQRVGRLVSELQRELDGWHRMGHEVANSLGIPAASGTSPEKVSSAIWAQRQQILEFEAEERSSAHDIRDPRPGEVSTPQIDQEDEGAVLPEPRPSDGLGVNDMLSLLRRAAN